MAHNTVPIAQPIRLRLANAEKVGLANYQTEIGLSVVTEAIMDAKITAFTNADSAVKIANTARSARQSDLKVARNAGYALAGVIKRFVTDLPGFGALPNAKWQELGFDAGSLAIARAEVEKMLGMMETFFKNNPTLQDAARGVTEANCKAKKDAIIAAIGALGGAKTFYNAQKSVEDAAFKALGKTMSDLVKELKLHLTGDDPRWYAFGLRRPDDSETPAAPHNLHVSQAGTGRVFADWDDVPGAERYHVFLQQGNLEPSRAATVEDSEAMLSGLVVGETVKIWVTALNDGGESVKSEILEIGVV